MAVRKRIIYGILSFLIILNIGLAAQPVYAAPKQKQLVNLENQQDLVVMFVFDAEVVDITFISPSGASITIEDSEVECNSGDLWRTYKITNAEAGRWSVEYDLQKNTEITYSIIESNYGLWLQYLNVGSITEDSVSVAFEADCETETLHYAYEIYAVSTEDTSFINKLVAGGAKSGEEKSVELDLTSLSSGNYVFRVDVYYDDGDAELFDSLFSDPIDYVNPNEPIAIADFRTSIDMGNLACNLDWSEFTDWGHDAYKVVVKDQNEILYNGDFEKNVTANRVLFSENATELQIKLYYKDDNVWSAPKEKTIQLQDEYLKLATTEVTSSAQAVIEYKVHAERELVVQVNEEAGTYNVTGEGNLSFNLAAGENKILAELACDDSVWFVIDTTVYYDTNPPAIRLFDNLDGKTFYEDEVAIIGLVTGSNQLTINGTETPISEQGEFEYLADLSLGENVIEIEAFDSNGNSSKMALTLFKGSKLVSGENVKAGLVQYLPLLITLGISLLLILLSIFFMRKKVRSSEQPKEKKPIRIWPAILTSIVLLIAEAGCIWTYINRRIFSNSMKFLELAEKSSSEAVNYLHIQKILGIASLGGLLIVSISIAITIIIVQKKKLAKANAA